MMQNHELVVSSFIANGEVINATVSVRAMAVPMLNIFSMEVLLLELREVRSNIMKVKP